MNGINTLSYQIIEWMITYVLHSTLIYIVIIMVYKLKVFSSCKANEALLRFALIGGVFSSLLQTTTGRAIYSADFYGIQILNNTIANKGFSNTNEWYLLWPSIIIALWITIVLFKILHHNVSSFLFIKSLKPFKKINQRTIKVIEDNKDLFEFNKVSINVLISTIAKSPFVYKQAIIIPEQLITKFDNRQIRCMLAHEITHVRRKDWYWLQLYNIIQTVFFFQPLNKDLKHKLLMISEILCDNNAIQLTKDRKSLASSILELASKTNSNAAQMLIGMAFHKSFIKKRVESIISDALIPKEPSKIVLSITYILLVLSCFALPKLSFEKKIINSEVNALELKNDIINKGFENQNKSKPFDTKENIVLNNNVEIELKLKI